MENTDFKTILVAEDDDANYKFLEIIIKLAGYHVIWAENGAIAVDKCLNNTISLVFMDLRMPEMDGLEATRLIRRFNTTIPIVAQTAYTLIDDEETALNAGCNKFITKPIVRKTVLSILDEYVKNE